MSNLDEAIRSIAAGDEGGEHWATVAREVYRCCTAWRTGMLKSLAVRERRSLDEAVDEAV